MRLSFWSVGKNHESYVEEGVLDFTRRIRKYFPADWHIISPPKNAAALPEKDLKKKEAELVLQLLKPDDFLVLLDEKGKMLRSLELADLIQQRATAASKQVIFLIGGAYGIDASLVQRAGFTWSLSPLTFPHQLVRLILAEQVYRACSILRNEKYHHS